jgi:serine/threonine-protein kinase PknK
VTNWLARRFEGWTNDDGAAPGIDRLVPTEEARVLLKRARSPEARAALTTELSVVGDHRAFRRVIDRGTLDGDLVGVFEWVEGDPLTVALTRGLSIERATSEILRALLALHARGWVHGDLKPEHLIFDGARLRLIDLGLACALGAAPRGGTSGYLAPEYLVGGLASVQGDLYALGRTLERAAGASAPEAIATLVAACVAEDPRDRPASAEAALATLGLEPRASDRGASVHRDAALLERAVATLKRRSGDVLAIEAARGSGSSSFARRVATSARAFANALEARYTIDHDPLIALADVFDVDASWDAARRAASALQRAAGVGVVVVLSDLDRATTEARDRVVSASRLLTMRGTGALVILGDAASTEPFGDSRARLPALAASDVAAMSSGLGVRLSARDRDALTSITGGRAGLVARALERMADDPTLAARDAVVAHVDTDDGRPNDLAAAERALRSGSPRRALAIAAEAPETVELRFLRARASFAAGDLEAARSGFAALEASLSGSDLTWLPRTLERLGRPDQAEAEASRALVRADDGATRAALAAILATSALALGRAADVETITQAHEPSAPPALAARLASLASDATLRLGDTPRALAHGDRAIALAEASGDPTAVGQALSRVAGAHGLAGDWARARDLYRRALEAAEAAGDVTALPPYVMNLAAAEHALTHYADALARYEEAASLADKLGRSASSAAALVNLGSLYASMGALPEAEAVLARAKVAAEAGGSRMVRAQVDLIGAEVLADRGDRRGARALARTAGAAFEAAAAKRQSLEAELLGAEIAAGAGEEVDLALLEGERLAALDAQGLGTRAHLLRAALALRRGELDAALRDADLAVRRAEHAGEREHLLPALRALAEIHARLGTGGAEGFVARARELRASLASRVPAGLRERFLERHPLPSATPTPTSSRGLGESGRRIVSLLRRALFAGDERLVLEAAIDEAIALVRAERAFLLMRPRDAGSSGRRPKVAVARNLDREPVRNSRSRFSQSVAERVLASGEPLVTASAADDPDLAGARSILDLGVRSIVCVPVRDPDGIVGALYLDHRFESGRFDRDDLEVVQALADVIGLCLENARLFRAAQARTDALERAEATLRQDAERSALEVERLSSLLEGERLAAPDSSGIVGQSPSLRAAVDLARRVAKSDLPILIEGESGTGKELFARFVHSESLRASKPLVAVNCASLPETLLESELFGHVRGAFSGAVRDHPGLFRAADGGTLFLDEIGEIPARVQARLLRALQEGEVRPVGGTRTFAVDVRVVAATNRKLEAELAAGRFREDLFFRLAGVRLGLPALRERPGDLALLVRSMLDRVAERDGLTKRLSPSAMAALHAHPFPGNVRELDQALRRAALVSEGETIEPRHLGLDEPSRSTRSATTLDRASVERALTKQHGNRTRAAEELGVSRVTLHRFLAREPSDVAAARGRPRKR